MVESMFEFFEHEAKAKTNSSGLQGTKSDVDMNDSG